LGRALPQRNRLHATFRHRPIEANAESSEAHDSDNGTDDWHHRVTTALCRLCRCLIIFVDKGH